VREFQKYSVFERTEVENQLKLTFSIRPCQGTIRAQHFKLHVKSTTSECKASTICNLRLVLLNIDRGKARTRSTHVKN
jgi:hypothetical protein